MKKTSKKETGDSGGTPESATDGTTQESEPPRETRQALKRSGTVALPGGNDAGLPTDPPMEVVDVTSVEQLEAACREAIVCEFRYKGKMWRVPGRRLTPAESDRVDMILEQAMPDLLPTAGADGQPRYNLRAPEFLEAKQKFKAQARALTLFLAYPIFAANEKVKIAVTPKVKIELLSAVMQDFFTVEIQEALREAAVGTTRLWERVNFF